MKPAKKQDVKNPKYPNRREFLSLVGMAALAVPAAAVAGPPKLAGSMPAPRPEPKKEEKKPFCPKTCGKEIDAQIKLLSDKDFKVRKQATAKLIAIGKAEGEEKKVAEQKRALLVARLEKLKTAKDPEVVQRSKLIIAAVTPKKIEKVVPHRPRGRIAGIRAVH